MSSPGRRPSPPASHIQSSAPPSPNLAQVIGLFFELRDLAHQLIDQQRQLAELLRSRPAERDGELDMLSVAEVARMISFDPKTIHRLLAEGELESVGCGQRLRVTRASVRTYIERHRGQ